MVAATGPERTITRASHTLRKRKPILADQTPQPPRLTTMHEPLCTDHCELCAANCELRTVNYELFLYFLFNARFNTVSSAALFCA